MKKTLTATLAAGLIANGAAQADDGRHTHLVTSLMSAINSYDANGALEVLDPDYRQHNPFIPDTAAGLVSLFPSMKDAGVNVETVLMLEDGDNVVAFNRWGNAEIFGQGCAHMAAFDFFFVNQDNKLAAHWDAMMCERPPNASGRSIADGVTEITDLHKTEENKAKLSTAFDTFINGTPEQAAAALTTYFHTDYRQHNPDGSDGIEGFMAAQMSAEVTPRWQFTRLHKLVGQGNYVLAISEGLHNGVHSVFYDLVRFENGKIAEHWDVIQAVPTEGLANDNTMFDF
ncbi:MAG: nuclear transport factor 2 family protein [Pseudomonadota bacterium]